jgi:hypothetical protein
MSTARLAKDGPTPPDKEDQMNSGVRLIAAMAVLALVLAGPLAPLVAAQQPVMPPRTDLDADRVSERQGPDVYDAGAVAMTAIGMPLKAAVCAISGVLGLTLLVTTFGSAHRGSAALVEEGCGQKWILNGDDLRSGGAVASQDYGGARD